MSIQWLNSISSPTKKAKQSYLKLAIKCFQLKQHVKIENHVQTFPSLQLNVNSKIIDESSQAKFEKTVLKETKVYNESTQSSVYGQEKNSWSCLKMPIKNKEDAKIQFQLKIQMQENNYAQALLNLAASLKKAKEDALKKEKNTEEQFKQALTVGKFKSIKLPYEIAPIELSLAKFLSQPYKIHQIRIDLKLDQPLPPIGLSTVTKDIQRQQASKFQNSNIRIDKIGQQSKRDGVLFFQLVYMPSINYSLKMRNIRLNTKTFQKQYNVGMRQTIAQRFPLQKQANEKQMQTPKKQQKAGKKATLKQKNLNPSIFYIPLPSYLKQYPQATECKQLKLTVAGWEQYKHEESFSNNAPELELRLNNQLDGLQVMLEIQRDKELEYESQLEKGVANYSLIGFGDLLNTNYPKKSVQQKEEWIFSDLLMESTLKLVSQTKNYLNKTSQRQEKPLQTAKSSQVKLQPQENPQNATKYQPQNRITLSYLISMHNLYSKNPKQQQNQQIIEFNYKNRRYELRMNYEFIMNK